MKRSKLIAGLIIAMLLFTSMTFNITAQENLRKEGRYYIADIKKEFQVKPGGDLVMERINGDVTITTWDKNIVDIKEVRKMDVYTKEEAEAIYKEAQSIYRQEGNRIYVGGEGSFRSYMSSRFTINLPKNFNVNIGTSGGDISVSELTGTVNLNTSGGDIILYYVDGLVDAKTSGGDVRITKNTKEVTVKTSGGNIEVIDVEGMVDAKTSGGDVIIKNNKAKVYARTSGGDIELINVGAEVDAKTSGGDINVDGTAGPITISTSGGDVDLRNIKGEVNASTSGGDIDAMSVLNGIKVSTSGGDIDLKDIKGFIEASTSGGDAEAEMTLTDFTTDHHVDLKSSGGDLTLWIPEKLPATIRAEIRLGRSSWRDEDYDVYSDFPLEKERDKADRGEEVIRAQGKINGGGDLINLITSSGNIYIKKLK